MKQIIITTALILLTAAPSYAGTLYGTYGGDFVVCSQREGTATCIIQWMTGQ